LEDLLEAFGRRRSRRLSALLLVAALFGLAYSASASAGTISVTTTVDQLNGAAPCSLREAVRTANADTNLGGCSDASPAQADTIVLPGADHDLSRVGSGEDAAANGDLDVTETLTVRGAGAELTGVDGNGATTNERVFHVLSPATLNLSRLAVHDGSDDFGGGVQADSGATLNLTNAAVNYNSAFGGGGGIYARGDATLTDSTVSGNHSDGSGGGISAAFPAVVTLTNSSVNDNRADAGLGEGGGGIFAVGDATLTDSTVEGNRAGGGANRGDAGGIYAAGDVTLTRSTVSGNRAKNGGSGGGVLAATTVLSDSTVSGNTASGSGGGILSSGGSLARSVVRRNEAFSEGGGIYIGGSMAIARSTIADNQTVASAGGGVFFSPTTTPAALSVTNSTLSGNEAAESFGGGLGSEGTTNLANVTITRNSAGVGGGVGNCFSSGCPGHVNLKNTIIARNRGSSGAPDCAAPATSQDYNLIGIGNGCSITNAGHDQIGTAATPIDARLGSLADNGGPTPTHALLSNSPAINSANPAAPGSGGRACEATDQRGVPRSLGGRCDKGAYERVTCRGKLVNRVGTNGAETLIGTPAADGILALGGADVLFGRAGNDGLCGGAGNDQLFGESGGDFLDGGPNTDFCNGGTEQDQAASCETTVSVP
jgi:CSLREA domain-containing protein